MEQEYRVEDAKDVQSTINLLEDRVYEFNSNKITQNDGAFFVKIVQDENSSVAAGIAGWTWACACEITLLWVSEALRGKGLGKKLLTAAENEAKARKCKTILVRSYSFQAPGFYEKNGYKVEFVVENFPEGYNYFTLKKIL